MRKRNLKFISLNIIVLIILSGVQTTSFSQTRDSLLTIEGIVKDNKTNATIPYAAIYNKSTGRGTLSNLDGYFKLSVNSYSDTIVVRYIGYKSKWYYLKTNQSFYTIKLVENIEVLNEVSVMPKDYDYLYDLIKKCQKKEHHEILNSRMYYELKSFVDEKQVELIECFYNGQINGFNLSHLNLKIGRAALQDNNKQFFLSVESSKAITALKLFDHNPFFPINPLELPKRRIKKNFKLRFVKQYQTESNDSVYVIKYIPRDTVSAYFSGKIWINKTKSDILKITLNCIDCKRHPFIPLFLDDKIASVNLRITKSFEEIDGASYFNHIDFNYDIVYTGRKYINRLEKNCTISSYAVLHAYNNKQSFFDPKFDYQQSISDYKKLNIVPYNEYFWDNHQELQVVDPENESFFNDSKSITNRNIFSPNEYFKNGILEYPFITWTGKRILFREFNEDKFNVPQTISPGVKKYVLSAKIYLDVIQLQDSIQILTKTIFDPYESYYTMEMDRQAQCFVNMYFDLIEIERRRLAQRLEQSDKTRKTISSLYLDSQASVSKVSWQFFMAVDEGKNEKEMLKWNALILKELQIDNIALFNPYPKEDLD